MNTIAREGRVKTVIQRSIFWTTIGQVSSRDAANAFIAARRLDEPKATHHVFAWRTGDPVSWEESSDDGEPPGTAGLPVMNVLRGAGLTNVVIVVSRIFGGVKLGTGGLVRAYGRCAASIVAHAGIIDTGNESTGARTNHP